MKEIIENGLVEFRSACDEGGSCVEVAHVNLVAVRNSTSPEGPVVLFTLDEWKDFLDGVRAGYFDYSDVS